MPHLPMVEVSLFCVIFDQNGILIITCFDKGSFIVVFCLGLKEFLEKCLAQFQVYIWSTTQCHNIYNYLDQIWHKTKIFIHVSKKFDQEFCMWNLHFLLDIPDKLILHNNLDVFFFAYPYIHANNTLLIDDMPYKSMFNGPYSAIFWGPLMAIIGKINICWGLFSLAWETFIHSNMVFSPLLNTIALVWLDVLINII